METVYITGHRNPDLDSLCSAYAYAKLKNILDPEKKYVAVRCGSVTEDADEFFKSLGIEPPPFKKHVYPIVDDIMLIPGIRIDISENLLDIAKRYNNDRPSVVPIYNGEKYYGLLSIDAMLQWLLRELKEKGSITEIPTLDKVIQLSNENLKVDDLFDDAKAALSASPGRVLPVFDGDEFAGYVTRRCFLKKPSHSVILVDHNEPSQSIKGIESANILEIVDHHRLGTLKTDVPIFIDAEPVGSTCTIVFQQYLRNGLTPEPLTAKVLLAGLISDTVILKSPTTTIIDIESANKLAELCGENVQDFGKEMFSHITGLKARNPKQAIEADFKTYIEKNTKVGIGQCETTTLKDLDEYKEVYLKALEDVRRKNGLDWAVLMITNVISECSVLLTTDYKANKYLHYIRLEDNIYDMPGVLSRKKQLLPVISQAVNQ